VHNNIGLNRPDTSLDRGTELGRTSHAVLHRQHCSRQSESDQAVSARRPLRRRPETIARPARVRIRNRKPCTRARRRLFGWKVRLPLATAFLLIACGRRKQPAHPWHVGRHEGRW
jgi:hypothetical protein